MTGFIDNAPVGMRLERMKQKARHMLGVSRYDSREQIKTAYLLMVKGHHPDCKIVVVEKPRQIGRIYSLQQYRNAKDFLLKQLQDGE